MIQPYSKHTLFLFGKCNFTVVDQERNTKEQKKIFEGQQKTKPLLFIQVRLIQKRPEKSTSLTSNYTTKTWKDINKKWKRMTWHIKIDGVKHLYFNKYWPLSIFAKLKHAYMAGLVSVENEPPVIEKRKISWKKFGT